MHGVGILKTAEDIGADLFMTLYSGVLLKKESARPFAFLDIDDETHWAWGEPLLTPRDNVTKLIQFAAEGRSGADRRRYRPVIKNRPHYSAGCTENSSTRFCGPAARRLPGWVRGTRARL